MASRSRALEGLRLALSGFTRAHELRLLHIEREDDAHNEVITLAAAMEFHADARGPVVVLDDASLGEGGGWPERVERLRAEHARRDEAVPELLRPFVWEDEHAEREPVARFGAAARAFADTLPRGSAILTVALTPSRVEDAERWSHELGALLDRPELADVRWIVADQGEAAPQADRLGAHARRYRLRLPDADTEALRATITYTRDGAPSLARLARAGPRVELPPDLNAPGVVRFAAVHPPPRRDAPQGTGGEERARAMAAMFDGAAALQAAANETDPERRQAAILDAISAQAGAVNHAQDAAPPEMVAHQLALAGYALAAGTPDAAIEHYERAARWAEGPGLFAMQAQATLAVGAIHEGMGRDDEAARAYGEAAQVAERAGALLLAVGAWQSAARHAERLDNLPGAVGALQHAVTLAESDAGVAAAVDAPSLRRRLADVLERVELTKEAADVRDPRPVEPDTASALNDEGDTLPPPDPSPSPSPGAEE